MKTKSTRKALHRSAKLRNPNILPEILQATDREANLSVRALAQLFDVDDLHVRRALFQWACEFTGVPESMGEPIHAYLRLQANAAMGCQRTAEGLSLAVNKYDGRCVRLSVSR